jgi:hypothetical protein
MMPRELREPEENPDGTEWHIEAQGKARLLGPVEKCAYDNHAPRVGGMVSSCVLKKSHLR